MKNKLLFLLGGSDLEMVEIKKILSEYKEKCDFLDAKLSWGASWNDYLENEVYQDKIENYKGDGYQIYGIELSGEIPEGCKLIDHHNEHQDKSSSINQVAELLGHELTRWQQLVAANDRGYIPAMEHLCASKDEINKIREADREAQGVTETDEKLAIKSIEEKKKVIDGVTVVEALTNKFSPITDRLYGRTGNKLLIYSDTELNYYGLHKNILDEEYNHLIKSGIAYSGGGSEGYFVIAEDKLPENEIYILKDEIIENISKAEKYKETINLHSHHIFMFPFKWRHWREGSEEKNINKGLSMQNRHNLEKFRKLLTKDESNWKHEEYELDNLENYNEYNYFYGHVREVMYDIGQNLDTISSKKNKHLINHFEYKPRINSWKDKVWTYNIKLANGKEYNLNIDSIHLNVFSTGTALIEFHLRNFKYKYKEEILEINQYGRRLHPPFFELRDASVVSGDEDGSTLSDALYGVKKKELACCISITSNDEKEVLLKEDYSNYLNKESFKYGPFIIPQFIKGLFPPNFLLEHQNKDKKKEKHSIYIQPVLDDRMFVLCWFGNKSLAQEFSKIGFKGNDWWYRFVFVDSPSGKGLANKVLQENLVEEHTYTRWKDYGTLYGVTRYSFVAVTSGVCDASFVVRHIQTLYYKMVALCLIQRATVLNFSDEVTHLSDLTFKENNVDKENQLGHTEQLANDIADLYKHYILFINKIYFREITAQEQGIEMYKMLQAHMHLEEDVKDLDGEINELHNYATFEIEKIRKNIAHEENKRIGIITIISVIFLPLALMATIFTSDIFPKDFLENASGFVPNNHFWTSISLIALTSISVLFGMDIMGLDFGNRYKIKIHMINKEVKLSFKYLYILGLILLIIFLIIIFS